MSSAINRTLNVNIPVTEADVEVLFQTVLQRSVNNSKYLAGLIASGTTIRQLVKQLRTSEELRNQIRAEIEQRRDAHKILADQLTFRSPQTLSRGKTPLSRVLIIGSCLSRFWADTIALAEVPCPCDLFLLGQDLPEEPPAPVETYNFQIIQLPLRFVLPDASFARLSQADISGHEKLFERASNGLKRLLTGAMRWNRQHGLLTFVFPFIVPQQNAIGRLLPRYDLRNPVYFIEKLNEVIARETATYSNAYFFDLNEAMATFGKRFVQEDMFWALNHASFITDFDFTHDQNRLEPVSRATNIYEEKGWQIVLAVWNELVSMYRSVRQIDSVKMVVVDLDDTLWRGVIAEADIENLPTSEGWPIGFWETLAILKRRGILLGIISKNEESVVTAAWNNIFRTRLSLDDFAVKRINWRPKADNMSEILGQVNLLPANVVYIDDNPIQRSEIESAFPGIRVLGGTPLTWRHILLWSSETQLPDITSESTTRTEMVQAQVLREEHRKSVSQEEFLASLGVTMNMFVIQSVSNKRFARALELINKTNQFNTTGRRWTLSECGTAFSAGACFYAFDLADKYTEYGLVGILIVKDAEIQQFVMSCRVMGLAAEIAAVAKVTEIIRTTGAPSVFGAVVETDRNLPCRGIYSTCGFSPTQGGWQRSTEPPIPLPEHIAVTMTGSTSLTLSEALAT